jgi:hypothetical protein
MLILAAALWPQVGPRSKGLPAREGYATVNAHCQHRMNPQSALRGAAANFAGRHVIQLPAFACQKGMQCQQAVLQYSSTTASEPLQSNVALPWHCCSQDEACSFVVRRQSISICHSCSSAD